MASTTLRSTVNSFFSGAPWAFWALCAFWAACALESTISAREIFVRGSPATTHSDGSPDRPFVTIAAALATAGPGDTVTVRGGVYRESIRVSHGSEERPFVLRAAPGERVIVSGARRLTGWEETDEGVFAAPTEVPPERLLLDYRELPVARLPAEGWWAADRADGLTLGDVEHLRTVPAGLEGGQAYIWTQHGNTFFTVSIEAVDRETGTLTIGEASRWLKLSPGDRYFLKNHPELIDEPRQWAVEKAVSGSRTGYRVHFRPVDRGELEKIEAPHEERRVLLVSGARNVRIEGLEIASAAKNGIEINRSDSITVTDCVVHNHGQTGIAMRDCRNVIVRRCISWNNSYGVTLHTVTNARIEENDIGHNRVDGLVVSWNSDSITVYRNAIHHHLLWGHPDNLQVYRGVTNLRIAENLLLAGGQSIMMEETSKGVIEDNVILGCGAYSVILGHGNSTDYRIRRNTIAFSGYGCLNLTGHGYDVRENVFMTGHPGPVYGVRGIAGYEADRNLFFTARGLDSTRLLCSDGGWNQSLDAFQDSTEQDGLSRAGDPRFASAPVAFGVLDSRRLPECSRDAWYLRKGSGPFHEGDTIEVDFDGIPRRVTAVAGDRIAVAPALPTAPLKAALLASWGPGTPSLDLRLRDDSPGANLAANGGPVGSDIDIQAYLRGDFDGDGKRDRPPLPPELRLR